MRVASKLMAGVALMALGCGTYGSALAQQGNDNQRQIDDAFRRVLEKPADLSVAFAYARLLVDAGNYEGAIAALERLLLLPNAPNTIHVELGVLYYRLGSYAAADSHLRRALAQPDLPPDVRRQAEALLSEATRRAAPTQLSGWVNSGVIAHSNARANSTSSMVRFNGLDVPRPLSDKPKSDLSFFVGGGLQHSYDLETQNEAAINSTLNAYGAYYTRSHSINIGILEGTTGIRFLPAPEVARSLFVRPHLIASYAHYGNSPLFYGGGVGLDVGASLTDSLAGTMTYELRGAHYIRRSDQPDNEFQSRTEHVVRGQLSQELAPGQILIGTLGWRLADTERGYLDYQGPQVGLTLATTYTLPSLTDDGVWSTTPSVIYGERHFGAANPAVDSATTRTDKEFRINLTQTIPLADQWNLVVQAEYTRVDSNLPNYRFDNKAGTVALNYRF